MNLPNLITLSRIAFIPVFMVSMANNWSVASMVLFIGISLTDALDGYLARRLSLVTDLGKLLDPLADKLLVTAAVLFFAAQGRMAVWMVMVIITREFLVSTLRAIAAAKGVVIAAGWSGKIKTTIQMIAITYMLSPWGGLSVFSTDLKWEVPTAWLMTLMAVWSGIDYIWKHRSLLKAGNS